jgi:hypothetical protein
MIVRLELVFFPHHERWAADEQDVFAVYRSGRGGLANEEETQEKEKWEQSFHRK